MDGDKHQGYCGFGIKSGNGCCSLTVSPVLYSCRNMKLLWSLFALLLLAAAVCGDSTAYKQQQVNRLLYEITDQISPKYTELIDLQNNFKPDKHLPSCIDAAKTVMNLLADIRDGRILEQKHYFSLFNDQHRKEALMLVEILLSCIDFEHFLGNAVYFRQYLNEGVFVYALYVAVTHSDHTRDVVLPPLYEITPHMFINTEVVHKAYTAKMTQTPSKIHMDFTGSQKNPEQRVAYFGEDVGMNSHHVHWHMDFPFWWHGYEIDRKGELFFWVHHQLTARFDAERLSNHLSPVDELHWDKPIEEGYAPHTTYRYGGEFPSRPDNKKFEDVVGIARVRDVKIIEERIRDAIAHGYIETIHGTKIFLDEEHGIDILGNIIESSEQSPNRQYYGSLHNMAHKMLGRQVDPKGKFNLPPGVMEHFETATRDPSFFRLHKYMDNIFKEHKDKLPPYTKDQIEYTNVEITDLKVIGDLVTYFEEFEIDVTNGIDSSEKVPYVPITASVTRLNHKPFSYDIEVEAKKYDKATIRIFMCPKFDENGIEYTLDEARWGCVEMDKFWVIVNPGHNSIFRKSSDSSVTVPDRTPFRTLIEEADSAVASGKDLVRHSVRACGHPNRLLLPKGNEVGVDFELFVAITSGDDAVYRGSIDDEFGGNHAYCGAKGQNYPDSKPMGYPLDRRIPDDRLFKVKNIDWITVKVKHDKEHH